MHPRDDERDISRFHALQTFAAKAVTCENDLDIGWSGVNRLLHLFSQLRRVLMIALAEETDLRGQEASSCPTRMICLLLAEKILNLAANDFTTDEVVFGHNCSFGAEDLLPKSETSRLLSNNKHQLRGLAVS